MDAMLAALDASFDGHGYVSVESVSWDDDEVSLEARIRVVEGDWEDAPVAWWAVKCRHVLEHRVVLGRAHSCFMSTGSHPLLWPHIESQSSCFLAGAAARCGFRSKPIADSGASRSLIPIEADLRFRARRSAAPVMPITDSGHGDQAFRPCRSPIPVMAIAVRASRATAVRER